MEPQIRHDETRRRFSIQLGTEEAHLDYVRRGETTLDFRHTFVPVSHRGRGIGARLVRHALDHAREHELRVVPTCPFVREFVVSNPEYVEIAELD